MRAGNRVCAVLTAAAFAAMAGVAGIAAQRDGYLAPGAFDVLAVLPPAPTKGDARYKADRAIYRHIQKTVGSPRWVLATADVRTDVRSMMQDFSCAAGISLAPDNAPRLAALVQRAGIDTSQQTNTAKNFYKRLRPYCIDPGKTCQPASELADSYDYPSGHTTWGWTWAVLLAELMPDRATPILARGRAYGESRIVCGAHNASAVEGGRLSAGSTLAAIQSLPAFRADLAAARTEIEGLRTTGTPPDARQCAATDALVKQDIFH